MRGIRSGVVKYTVLPNTSVHITASGRHGLPLPVIREFQLSGSEVVDQLHGVQWRLAGINGFQLLGHMDGRQR
jgi:hypothetical protein